MTPGQELMYRQYIKNSNIPALYLRDTELQPETEDLEVFKQLKHIESDAANFVNEGNNLLLCSHYAGNGKTSWATRILKAYVRDYACKYAFNKADPIIFINVPELLEMKKQAIKVADLQVEVNRIDNCIYNSKVVVFDDISSKNISDYDMNSLYCWINYRTARNMSCIYTSNAEPSDLQNTLSENISSRIIGYSYVKVLQGGDRRSTLNKY